MNKINFDMANNKLNQIYELIFSEYEISNLTSNQKRQIIFNYLSDNLEYDYELLDGIKRNYENSNVRITRDLSSELMSALFHKKGICNAIAQEYKLLLEKAGIYALCICCNDSTSVPHQLNLVYDKENNTFSFDDVTSVIVARGSKEDYFNYDLNDASRLGQGNEEITQNQKWIAIPSEMVYFLVSRDDNDYNKLGFVEQMGELGVIVPENIEKSSLIDIDGLKEKRSR